MTRNPTQLSLLNNLLHGSKETYQANYQSIIALMDNDPAFENSSNQLADALCTHASAEINGKDVTSDSQFRAYTTAIEVVKHMKTEEPSSIQTKDFYNQTLIEIGQKTKNDFIKSRYKGAIQNNELKATV